MIKSNSFSVVGSNDFIDPVDIAKWTVGRKVVPWFIVWRAKSGVKLFVILSTMAHDIKS